MPIVSSMTEIITAIVEIHILKLCRNSSTSPFECFVKNTPENILATRKRIVNKSLIPLAVAVNTKPKNPTKVETELKIYTAGRIKSALSAKSTKSSISIPRIPLTKSRVAITQQTTLKHHFQKRQLSAFF